MNTTTTPASQAVEAAEREKFEATAVRLLGTGAQFRLRDDGLYDHPPTYDAYEIWKAGRAELASQQEVAAPVGEADMLQVIDERDLYHEVADDLAAQIAAITGQEIGEHSSANDPWHNAMLAADEFIAQQLRDMVAAASRVPVASGAEPEHWDKLRKLGWRQHDCKVCGESWGAMSEPETPPMAVGAGGSVGTEPIGEVLVGNMTAILYDALPVGTKLYLATPATEQAAPALSVPAGGGETRIIEPPKFAPRPSISDGMSPDDLWAYACLVGYRYKLSEHDKLQSAQYASAAPLQPQDGKDARTELTPAQIEKGWKDTFSTDNPFCPCNLKSFTKAARWTEHAIQASEKRPAGTAGGGAVVPFNQVGEPS